MLTTSCPHLCTSTLFMLWDGNEIKSQYITSTCKPQSKKLMESLLSVDDIHQLWLHFKVSAVAVAKLLLMTTKIAILMLPVLQGKLHALPRALGLNYNPLLLPFTWHILGAKMDAKEYVTEPPAECNSWTCMLKYWSQPDDLLNAWTCDRDSDLIASFTHTYIKLNNCSVTSEEIHQALLKAPLLTTEWHETSTMELSLTRQHHYNPPAPLTPEDQQRHHSCCHREYKADGHEVGMKCLM